MTITIPSLSPGEHVVGGVTLVVVNSGHIVWRSDCTQCVRQGKGAFAPDHDAMSNCKSGSRAHCTCDGCF